MTISRQLVRAGLLFLAAAMAAATVVSQWWAVALVAGLYGLLRTGHVAHPPRRAALAAVLAWGGLLAFDAVGPRFGAVVGGLSGAMQLPAVVLVLVTLAFAALQGWSAATVGEAIATFALRRADRAAGVPPVTRPAAVAAGGD